MALNKLVLQNVFDAGNELLSNMGGGLEFIVNRLDDARVKIPTFRKELDEYYNVEA